jgi:hypothetical protein
VQGALVPALMFLGLRRAFSPLVAWLASSAAAASTALMLLSSTLDNETPYLLRAVLSLLWFEPLRALPSAPRLVAWSVLNGVACLFRVEHALFYALSLALLLLGWSRAGAQRCPRAASGPIAAVSRWPASPALLPWHLHAWRAVQRFRAAAAGGRGGGCAPLRGPARARGLG